jgi:hypothetical protein
LQIYQVCFVWTSLWFFSSVMKWVDSSVFFRVHRITSVVRSFQDKIY